ncbi:MAG: sugar phosphate isomerase/epimerase [Desulfovibrio sp.]|nr:sugar phosphate isomerase/epimerase [Desulfovibrio sp.]
MNTGEICGMDEGLRLGVQSQNAIGDKDPAAGFAMLRRAGFASVDFSLHGYLRNRDIYRGKLNTFFDSDIDELRTFFSAHKAGAKKEGIVFGQMHMPYPIYVPTGSREVNDYLRQQVAPKSMELCAFFECPCIVIHGFKLARVLGSEEAEWEYTEAFIHEIAPMAREMGITICVENLYDSVAGHIVEGPCCHVRRCAERIDRINDRYGAEVLGFCLDTGHANLVGIDFEDFITQLGHRLKVLHIHDNDAVQDLHQIPFTFAKTRENKASTDWEGFLRGLRAIRYEGILNFETGPVLRSFPEELKEEALGFIASIGTYFAKALVRS